MAVNNVREALRNAREIAARLTATADLSQLRELSAISDDELATIKTLFGHGYAWARSIERARQGDGPSSSPAVKSPKKAERKRR